MVDFIKECPNSGITDPLIPNVFNCLSWVAYLKSQGQNLQQWCNVPNNYKKCCLTCQSNLINNNYINLKYLHYNVYIRSWHLRRLH